MPRKAKYADIVTAPVATPNAVQAHPLEVPNAAGGWSFKVDMWTQARRFLILGSEGGTYYIGEKELTLANMQSILACIQADGRRLVNLVAEVSQGGYAAKNNPAIFALALACSPKFASPETVRYALARLPAVCRTLTHLYDFVAAAQTFRGWGRGLRRGIKEWFIAFNPDSLAYQAVKYRQREGWTARDVLRLAHPASADPHKQAVLRWMVGGQEALSERTVKRNKNAVFASGNIVQIPAEIQVNATYPDLSEYLPSIIQGYEIIARLGNDEAISAAAAIANYKLPREAVPTHLLSEAIVWRALLEDMPYTAMLRNLATMTRVGLFDDPEHRAIVLRRLVDQERISKARVHPIAILAALKTYAQGHGQRGGNTWTPLPRIIDALDKAYYMAFANVEPNEARVLIGIDVSGSMDGTKIVGLDYLSSCEGAAALALPMLAAYPNAATIAFDDQIKPLNLSARQRLDDATNTIQRMVHGGTNCALPILWATQEKQVVDVFVILTDSESWQGRPHPFQALEEYRRKVNPAAKLAVIAMCANESSVANPDDAGVMNLVGFDANAPALLDAFVKGAL